MPQQPETDAAIPQRLVGRTAAALLLVGGTVGVLTPFLPYDTGTAPWGVIIAGVAALLTGVIVWLLPWEAWPRSRSLWLVPIAFAYIAIGNHFGNAEPFRYAIYFVVAFMWIGIAHPPRTSLAFAPLFVAAYLIPFFTTGQVTLTGLSSIAVVGPCCVVLGETVAWLSQRLQRAQATFHRELGERRFRSMAQNSFDVLLILDARGHITYASPAIQRILGHDPEQQLGRNLLELLDPLDHPWLIEVFRDLREEHGALRSLEFRIRAGNSAWRTVQAMGKNLLDDPAVEGMLIALRDITEQKTLEQQLKHQAFHDSLTGLANRALFVDRVEHAVARLPRARSTLAVLFLDLDDFKTVNDSLGHAAGDALLVQVAERIRREVRPSDTAARLGGDEFAILLEDLSDAPAEAVADRVLRAIAVPLDLQGKQLSVRGSIGIACPSHAGETAEELLRNADIAMYWAKGRGKGRTATFEARMRTAAVVRLELQEELTSALERGEFSLRYQPLVSLRNGACQGFEALLRWDHPRRGTVLPNEFIGLAEEIGAIIPIGTWVIEEACRQARDWSDRHPSAANIRVGVNVSPRQLEDDSLLPTIARVLDATGLAPSRLTLEITESVLMADPDAALVVLRGVKELGVRVAIDDFGTGYSSLSHLHRFPIDTIKIDRTFMAGLRSDGEESALVRSILKLGDALRLETIAEGIEHAEELARLRRLGARVGQGYLFARPMTATEASAFLERGREALAEGARPGSRQARRPVPANAGLPLALIREPQAALQAEVN